MAGATPFAADQGPAGPASAWQERLQCTLLSRVRPTPPSASADFPRGRHGTPGVGSHPLFGRETAALARRPLVWRVMQPPSAPTVAGLLIQRLLPSDQDGADEQGLARSWQAASSLAPFAFGRPALLRRLRARRVQRARLLCCTAFRRGQGFTQVALLRSELRHRVCELRGGLQRLRGHAALCRGRRARLLHAAFRRAELPALLALPRLERRDLPVLRSRSIGDAENENSLPWQPLRSIESVDPKVCLVVRQTHGTSQQVDD